MKTISSRQAGMLLFISIISMKFVLLPAIMMSTVGTEAYISILIRLLLDFLIFLVYVYVYRKNKDISFIDYCEQKLGAVGAKIIYIILFSYFFIKALITLKSLQNYMVEVLFDDLDLLHFLLPTMAFLGFVIFKDIRCMARSVELIFYISLTGLVLGAILSFNNINILDLIPIFDNGLLPIGVGILSSSICFGDYTIMIILMGRLNFNTIETKKIKFYIAMAIIFTMVFYVCFTVTFGRFGVNESLAVSDLSLNANSPETIARLDWLIIIIWLMNLILQGGLSLLCANEMFVAFFKFKNRLASVLIIVLFMSLAIILLRLSVNSFLRYLFDLKIAMMFFAVQFGIPLLLLLFSGGKNDASKKNVAK